MNRVDSMPGAPSLPAPSSPRAWLLAARPQTLPAAIAPVAVGTACAYAAGGLRAGPAAAAALGALLLQIAANFANDVFDFEKGADREGRLGPTRAVQAGLLSPSQMRRGLVVALAAALAVGVYLAAVAGWPVVALGLTAIAAAVAYTGGPFPLGYHGLGDLLVLVFFGFVAVCGTAFVQLGGLPGLAIAAAVPVGALATAILVVNNLRDRAGDAAAGKRTLAVRLGARGARLEYAGLLAAAYAAPIALAIARGAPLLAAPLVTLPWGVRLGRAIWRRDGAALNPCLPATARLLLAHSLMWAAVIAAWGR
ncbi:MAG TPA: 1,4-dihydroxy-2-naphthoate polyprenyltransferase [Kofleriaceae bacterium]|nr:1,4-dihydroxy-2-naphthoate polyprenyltransferase [Kofleriaceae bacterium]